jgi:hypothetical protein
MNVAEPQLNKKLLNPVERISEILFGLIMALTFTCTLSIIESDRGDVKDMLTGAIGCNIAWGLVDAVMYLLMTITEKGHDRMIFNFVRKPDVVEKAHRFIADSMPASIASVMKSEELESIRQRLLKIPEPSSHRLNLKDFKIALGLFILVFLSTLPVAIPFVLIENIQSTIRASNCIAIIMMFICGWILGKYAGRNRLVMGLLMSLTGIFLVLITISLGG